MKPHNGNPAAMILSLRLHVRGIENPLYFRVPKKEWDRLNLLLNGPLWGEGKVPPRSFVAFRALEEPVDVLIRTSLIQLVQFLADPAIKEAGQEPDAREWQVRLHLLERKEPVELLLEDPSSAREFFVRLDVDPDAVGKTFTFADVDGEEAAVVVDEIVVAEIASELEAGKDDA